MAENKGPQPIGEILRSAKNKKPPAYPWQELALRVISELSVPSFKRNAVFKVCRENRPQFIELCLNDTKELCPGGGKWKYFFKLVANKDQPNPKSTVR